jgi:hypothetical protein
VHEAFHDAVDDHCVARTDGKKCAADLGARCILRSHAEARARRRIPEARIDVTIDPAGRDNREMLALLKRIEIGPRTAAFDEFLARSRRPPR